MLFLLVLSFCRHPRLVGGTVLWGKRPVTSVCTGGTGLGIRIISQSQTVSLFFETVQ